MSQDLKAAANAARYLASMVASIRALSANGASRTDVQRLVDELADRYDDEVAAIRAVAGELQQVRECRAARFGDIVAPTAHEVPIKMVLALNQEWFGMMERLDRKPVVEWPDVDEVSAEIQLENTRAQASRDRIEMEVEWTKPDLPSHWAKVFNVSLPTFLRWLAECRIRSRKLGNKSYQINIADLPAIEKAKHRGDNNGPTK